MFVLRIPACKALNSSQDWTALLCCNTIPAAEFLLHHGRCNFPALLLRNPEVHIPTENPNEKILSAYPYEFWKDGL
jgi:hypothetical protein